MIFNFQSYCNAPLPSVTLYRKLESDFSSESIPIVDICKTSNSSYNQNDKFLKLCSAVVNYLRDNSSKNTQRKNRCNHCKLLNYWIYEKIVSTFGENEEHNKVYKDLQTVLTSDKENQKPKDNNFRLEDGIITDKQWKEKKEFHEYCEDYSKIIRKKLFLTAQCNVHKKYMEDKPLLNNNYWKRSLKSKIKECSKEYRKSDKCYPEAELSEFLEKGKISSTQRRGLMDRLQTVILERGGLEDSVTYQAASAILDNYVDTDKLPFANTTNIIVSSVLSLMGTLLMFFLWYKFTPLGALCRGVIGKIRKFRNKPKHKKAFSLFKFLLKSKNKKPGESLLSIPYTPT
ncbi:PIR protein [Plasmodium ovale]|uniref:PIR Superfamily Protein n=2 Tax=Plasmodium ovale TaxID=36330 RepID=A0A1A8X297_PLAOA|nr:PIR Superfamily Protein [Plasmodium ovale curtisi]SBT85081.1 PIR protein [Plasmodium ovale]